MVDIETSLSKATFVNAGHKKKLSFGYHFVSGFQGDIEGYLLSKAVLGFSAYLDLLCGRIGLVPAAFSPPWTADRLGSIMTIRSAIERMFL
jgi:hypothetical protein